MASKTEKVFIDTSAFKALLDSQDIFNVDAEKKMNELVEGGLELVTSNFMIDECLTLLRAKCGLDVALKLREYLMYSKQTIKIYRVLVSDEKRAWEWFESDWSKLSFTDCVTFVQMKRLGIKKYFGFDAHFDRAGFVRC